MVIATFMKYSLHVIDSAIEHQWENRNVYLLYGELITGNNPSSSQNVEFALHLFVIDFPTP